MKTDFKNISGANIKSNSVFFLYGNNKKPFGVFCDFVIDDLKKKFSDVDVYFPTVAECKKIMENQCDLFGTKVNCFCIKGVEDSHLEKLDSLLATDGNCFILDSGDYGKSKKITDALVKDPRVNALPSFKNDLTLMSLCKMLLPSVPSRIYNEIIEIINNTDENYSSLFKKIFLLIDGGDFSLLDEYYTYKSSFLNDMEPIPLVRFLQQSVIKERILAKSQDYLGFNLSDSNLVENLLRLELEQKFTNDVTKSRIYEEI